MENDLDHWKVHETRLKDSHAISDPLYVIGVISNPVRYESRWKLYHQWEKEMLAEPHVRLLTVEMAFGNRPFMVTEECNPNHLRLRSNQELWHKEAMINAGLRHLTSRTHHRGSRPVKYVAWIDCDVSFMNPHWVDETLHALQHYDVVQMWQTAIDLGPKGEALQTHESFCSLYSQGVPLAPNWAKYPRFGHPGFAWAARMKTLRDVGLLCDFPILGSADHHMAWAMIGKGSQSLPGGISRGYRERLAQWEKRAAHTIQGNLGYVPGTLIHSWHGKKKDRRYSERWDIIKKHGFDPDVHLHRDDQGLWALNPGYNALRDEIRHYFRQRNEDSVDPE